MSPSALLRACAHPGCPELVESGSCPTHTRQAEQRRGSAASRGYDYYWTSVFRPFFINLLIAAGIPPVCGAALPGGPSMAASRCRAEGRLEWRRLHLDHDPPLKDDERRDRKAVCNPMRVGFLCWRCHSAKTVQEMRSR